MYYTKKIKDNPSAIELIRQSNQLSARIHDLERQFNEVNRQILTSIGAFEKNEVIRDTETSKEYVVFSSRIIQCDENEVKMSCIIHPVKKNGEVSRNECHEQFGDRVERTGKQYKKEKKI